ncbi:MAM and LDL-receptor class A domain-containing protein 1-like [Orbicella faveolata]|uniref:MAM and LDL-receptor class A domain-containing protein 1-like n=1 Tax=Orbicella faveolata TaxID=48498 RepID=UPI0009E63D26|nr:MAM and LDL-receptor class A domain-containing protein 1-like [Orbicella faveolata]
MNESTVTRRPLGYITVNESFVEECSFESASGLCPKWNTGGKWKFSSRNKLSGHNGYFAYAGGSPYTVKLETPLISAGDSVRLCLTFRYSMRGQSGSSLNVSLKSVHDESEVLIYNLFGYHGDTWSKAQVSWTETKDSKIVFRGFTNSVDEFAIGIDDVKIFTSNCEVYPVFSSPGKTLCSRIYKKMHDIKLLFLSHL